MKYAFKRMVAAAIMTAVMLAGCTTTGQDTNQTTSREDTTNGQKILRVNNTSEPGSLHPALATGTHDSFPLFHMFEGLYEKDPNGGDPIFAVAESADVSEDGKVWTFKLNPAAKWSNGDQVTANDFLASYQFCLNKNNAARYATQFFVFENAEDVYNGNKPMEELGIKALDESTLELRLITPMTYLPDYLTHYTFFPIHAKTQEEHPKWYTSPENYISNGPFTLSDWKNKESFTMLKNPHFRRANDVKLDGMTYVIIEDASTTYQMFQAGQLDANYPLPPAVIEQLNAEQSSQIHNFETLSTDYYMFNTQKAPFNNVKVRKALSISIDRQALCDNVLKGGHNPTTIMTCPGILDGHGDYCENLGPQFTEDIEEAKKLLEEGLAEEGMSIDSFQFSILYNTTDQNKKVAEAIQAMWMQNLGIQVGLENAEFQVVLDRRKAGNFDVCRAGWSGDYSDPMTFLELLTSKSDYNDGKWYDEKYDALIAQAARSADNDERMALMKEAEAYMISEMAVMPLFNKKDNWVIQDYVTGYYKPINHYTYFKYADMEL